MVEHALIAMEVRYEPAPTAASSDVWYYCRKKKTYYPYARSCADGWEQVPTHPAQ